MNQEEKLIDYLYGEMSALEMEAFEQELTQSPALQAELNALQEGRAFLSDLPDVQPPTTFVELKDKVPRWRRWLLPVGIAASLLLLLEVFDFQVNKTPHGLAFSFGEVTTTTKEKPPQYVTMEQVQALLEGRESAYRNDVLLRDSLWQNRMAMQEKSIRNHLNRQIALQQTKQQKEMANITQKLRNEEFPEIANLVQNLLSEHQQETRVLFGEAMQSWQAARDIDLNSIRSEFANVYQNQNETDAILLNVINSGDD